MPLISAKKRIWKSERHLDAPNNSLPFSLLRGLCVGISCYKYGHMDISYQPWSREDCVHKALRTSAIKIRDGDERGFVSGQRLERHGKVIISSRFDTVFPACWGVDVTAQKISKKKYDKLWPQNGNLKDYMFRPKSHDAQEVLHQARDRLNWKMDGRVTRSTGREWEEIKDPAPRCGLKVVEEGKLDEKAAPELSTQRINMWILRNLEIGEEDKKAREDEIWQEQEKKKEKQEKHDDEKCKKKEKKLIDSGDAA